MMFPCLTFSEYSIAKGIKAIPQSSLKNKNLWKNFCCLYGKI